MAELLRSPVEGLQGFSTIPTVVNRLGISEPFPIWTPSCLPPLRVNSRHQLYTRLNDEEGGLWGGSFLVARLRKPPNHHCFDGNFSPKLVWKVEASKFLDVHRFQVYISWVVCNSNSFYFPLQQIGNDPI